MADANGEKCEWVVPVTALVIESTRRAVGAEVTMKEGVVRMAIVRWKPITRWDPFDELLDIQRGLNRIFTRGVDQGTARNHIAIRGDKRIAEPIFDMVSIIA